MKDGLVLEVWPPEQIKQIVTAIPNPTAKFLLAGYFGTGARLREFLELRKKNFSNETKEGVPFVKVLLPTYKNKRSNARTIHLFPNFENWFVEPLMERVNALPDPESKLFSKSGRWVELRFQEWFGKHPHFFRHCRATYNYTFWHMTDMANKEFMGWTDTQPSATYVHLKESDLIDSMIAKLRAMP